MIKLFEYDAIDYSSFGLGDISNIVTRAESDNALNKYYTAEIDIKHDKTEKWKLVKEGKIIYMDGQPFRIHKVIDNATESTIYCRHRVWDLLRNEVRDVRPTNKNCLGAMQDVLNGTNFPHPFTASSDIATVNTQYFINKNPMQCLIGSDSILTRWGGELEVNNHLIVIKGRIGADNGASIEYGKNIKGVEIERDWDSLITRMRPKGKDGLELPEVYVDSAHLNEFDDPYIKEVEFDIGIDADNNIDEAAAIILLRAAALEYYTNTQCDIPIKNIKVDLVLLENTTKYKAFQNLVKVRLGDTVQCTYKDLGINHKARIIRIKKDLLTGKNADVEIGSFTKTTATALTKLNGLINDMASVISLNKTDLQKAIDESTTLLTNALGGYVAKRPGEILIMDTEDPATATKLWRMNLNGFGYSSTGINGPYGIAITMNGKINASFITTESLSAISANLGTVTAGRIQDEENESYWDLDNKEIVLNVKSLKILSKDVATVEGVDDATGKNKWLVRTYNISGTGSTIISFDTIAGKTADTTFEWSDLDATYLGNLKEQYVGHATTYVYLDADYVYNSTVATDDNGAVYLNGVLMINLPTTTLTPITLNFKAGWNQVDVLWGENLGGDGFAFTDKFSSLTQIKKMACYLNVNPVNEKRIAQAESEIKQSAIDWTAKFNYLQVGGVNHFGRLTRLDYFVGTGSVWRDSTGEIAWGFATLGTGSGGSLGTVRIKDVIDSIGDWTVSFWCKSNANTPINVDICDVPAGSFVSSTEWKYYSFTANVTMQDAEIYDFVDIFGLGYAYYYFDRVKIEKGNKATDWSPHPSELYAGVTTINRDGVNVGNSASDINTQLAYNGLRVLDGSTELASFGSGGAIVPVLQATLLKANVMNTTEGTQTYNIGNGYPWPTITAAINNFTTHKILTGGMQVNFVVYTPIYDIVELTGFSGNGGINIIFGADGVINGSLYIHDNDCKIWIGNGNDNNRGNIKWSSGGKSAPIYLSMNKHVQIVRININGNGNGAAAIDAKDGGISLVMEVDMVNTGAGIWLENGAIVASVNNRGNTGGFGLAVSTGSVAFLYGSLPNANSGIYYAYGGVVVPQGSITGSNSTFSPPAVNPTVFVGTFGHTSVYTVSHDTASQDTYYGASAAQNRWDSSMAWKDGVFTFDGSIYNYWQGGYNVLVEMRVRRKNSSHGSSGGVAPAPYNFAPSESFNAVGRGIWTEWTTVPSSVFGSGGATLKFYNGVSGASGYAIWDAAEVKVTVTKNV